MSETQEAFYRLAPHLVDLGVDEKGRIDYAGARFVWFHTTMFAKLFETMKEVVGPVIDEEIREFGVEAGRDIAARLDEEFSDTGAVDALKLIVASGFDIGSVREIAGTEDRDQFEKILGIGMYDGWVGPAEFEAFDEETGAVRIASEQTFESESYGETGQPECKFIAGVLQGILDHFWETDVDIREEQCLCAGDDRCVFAAQ